MNLVKVLIGKITATVDSSISDKLARADKAMFAATGQHIRISYSYRSTETQAKLYAERKPGSRVAPPGKSFHEKGLAIDVVNWKESEPYLRAEGFKNNLIDDKGHFSIGEFGTLKTIAEAGAKKIPLLILIIVGYFLLRK